LRVQTSQKQQSRTRLLYSVNAHHRPIAICPQSSSDLCRSRTKFLAKQLQLPCIEKIDLSFAYVLTVSEERIELLPTHTKTKPICANFLNPAYQKRLSRASVKNELIAKAVGVGKIKNLNIIDATAGLGEDSFLLAKLGCHVLCLERSNIIAALLQDGIQRFVQNYPLSTIHCSLIHADAILYLHQLTEIEYPDVIYLDPMFPDRQKSAFVKKKMRILRDIVGYDLDAAELLLIALKKAKQRVVIKRPRLAPNIEIYKSPDWALTGKSSRFDVYQATKYQV